MMRTGVLAGIRKRRGWRRHAAEKFARRDGATVVFALVGFAIAAVVSMVIVSAASSNANRVRNQRDKEQAYLYVSSAARLVTDAMKDYEFDYEPTGSGSFRAKSPVETPATAQENLQSAVGTMALAVANDGTPDATELTVTVGADSRSSTKVALTMGGDAPYNVTATISWTNGKAITYSAVIEFGATEHTASTFNTVKWPASQVRATKEPLPAAGGGE